MNQIDELRLENNSLRDRLSRLSEASLRINESLEFDKLLQIVVDSACSLTGARYGGITVTEEGGQLPEFVSSGFTPEEHMELFEMPHGTQLFESLGRIGAPLRIGDLASYARSLGVLELNPPVVMSSALVAPIRNGGVVVGTIYLTMGEGGREFTREDEETLVMFASQAAMVISNARRYRDELLARADLEALVNTTPVGVVVFDAKTGIPVSINREARRIVSPLLAPDGVAEDLIGVAVILKADGSEVPLEGNLIARSLSTGGMLRAEELVLKSPEGHSVAALMNATPIHSENGEVESFIITLQDMTPLEELEQLRTEFLGMVGHELRAPLASIKGSAVTLLESAAALELAEMTQFHRIINEQADYMRDLISDLIDVVRIETGTLSVNPHPVEVARLIDEGRNFFLNAGGRNNIRINIAPELPLVMADRRRIVQVITNLLFNASRNSHEASAIRVSVVQDDLYVTVSIADDGRGVPVERLPYLFRKFSHVESDERGRDLGLGLAICKGIVEAHGGRIWAESDGPGLGSRFIFAIPAADESSSATSASTTGSTTRIRRSRSRSQTSVLAVDDDPRTLKMVRDALSSAGYDVIVTGDPEEVSLLMDASDPAVVLLDLMLPGTDGIQLMRAIHSAYDVPVIFLSGYGQEEVISRAFEMGATDYVTKPFSPTELAARVRAALRRKPEPFLPYEYGELAISYAERIVTVADRAIDLTATEFRLLAELSASAGIALTHDQLIQRVWGPGRSGDPRPMRTMVRNLRQKLGDHADNPKYIFTVPRVGYRMPRAESTGQESPLE